MAGELLDRMLNGGGELVTLVLGAGAGDGLARALERRVAETHPGVEVAVHTVARPDVPVLIGVAVKVATPRPGEGPTFVIQLTDNGLFIAFTALSVFLPATILATTWQPITIAADLSIVNQYVSKMP